MDPTFAKMILILAVTVAQAQMSQLVPSAQELFLFPSVYLLSFFFLCHAVKKLEWTAVNDTSLCVLLH